MTKQEMIRIIKYAPSHFQVMGGGDARVHEKAERLAQRMLDGEEPVKLKRLKDIAKLLPKPIF